MFLCCDVPTVTPEYIIREEMKPVYAQLHCSKLQMAATYFSYKLANIKLFMWEV
jgi:hypothetical protein